MLVTLIDVIRDPAMPTIPQAYHDGKLISVESALQMRAQAGSKNGPKLVFLCPECKGLVRPHSESRSTAKVRLPAHFEHKERSDCSLSHRERVPSTAMPKDKRAGDHVSDRDTSEESDKRAILSILQTVPDRTECTQLIQARIGQGRFRELVIQLEPSCRITGIADARFLIASHIKPWSVSSNEERLEGDNGLMLSPHIDHLFDKGYITFERNGTLQLSSLLPAKIANALGVAAAHYSPKPLRLRQWQFMEYHREHIFRRR